MKVSQARRLKELEVENLSEPKTWYDYVASAALTMASPAAKGALSFVSPQTRSAATNWLQ